SSTISVPVFYENAIQADEQFFLQLSNVSLDSTGHPLATITRSTGTATIVDTVGPSVSVSQTATIIDNTGNTVDVNGLPIREGNTGDNHRAEFFFTLSAPSPKNIQINYTTVDGTGKGGVDYVTTAGSITIPAGKTTPVDANNKPLPVLVPI